MDIGFGAQIANKKTTNSGTALGISASFVWLFTYFFMGGFTMARVFIIRETAAAFFNFTGNYWGVIGIFAIFDYIHGIGFPNLLVANGKERILSEAM